MLAGASHWIWSVLWILAALIVVIGIPIQRRALNKIAFGRSMFISWTAIIMGFIVSLFPSVSAAIVAVLLFLIGFGFMALMAAKSIQHLQRVRQQHAAEERHM